VDLFDALGSLLGLAWNLRKGADSEATDPFQAELAAIAGPKTESGYHLPVKIRLRKEPWGVHGAWSVFCLIDGRPVGYLNPEKLTSDIGLRLEQGSLTGEPVLLDGYIVGGWTRDSGRHQGAYRVEFEFDLGDSPLDADMKEVLELRD
jgi:hypothetical protein